MHACTDVMCPDVCLFTLALFPVDVAVAVAVCVGGGGAGAYVEPCWIQLDADDGRSNRGGQCARA
jgi:hypothetical protein